MIKIILIFLIFSFPLHAQVMTNDTYKITSDTFDCSIIFFSSGNGAYQMTHSVGQTTPMKDSSFSNASTNLFLQSGYLPLSIILTSPNTAPFISLVEPDGKDDTAVSNYTIKWVDSDPDDDASISFYYDTDKTGYNGTLIAKGLSEDDSVNQYIWDCSEIKKGAYYIYAIIDDGINPPVYAYSLGTVTLILQSPKYDEPKVEVLDDFKKPGEEKEFDIGVNLNKAGKVTIEVYDIQGELVHTICRDEQFDKGYHNIRWEVKNALGSGVYWVVMKGEDWTKTKRVAIVK